MTKATVTGLKLDTEGNFTIIDITAGLKPLQEAVDGTICGMSFGRTLYAYGNDEALYEQPLNPFATKLYTHFWGEYVQPIHGNVVFTGGVDDEGYDVSHTATLEGDLKLILS